jgi:transposase
MLALGNSKILIYTDSIDMRCSFDRLALLVVDVLKQDSFSGHYFVFLSKCKRKMKILQWDRDGYAIYYKRLESGIFDVSRWMTKGQGASLEIDKVHFTMMMAGINFSETKKQKRYSREAIEFGAQNYRVTDSKDYVSDLGR